MRNALILVVGAVGGIFAQDAKTPESEVQASQVQWQKTSEPYEDTGVTTTVDDRRGNWYEKRHYFFEARADYEKLRSLVQQIITQQPPAIDKIRDRIVQEITSFVSKYSFKEGIIDELLTKLTVELEQDRKKDIQLTEKERVYLKQITDHKKELELLKKDIQQFNELIMGLDKAFATVSQQIARVQEYEQKGWENYDKIGEVLSDEIADRLSREIKSFIVNVELIEKYLQGDFTTYLEKTEIMVKENSTKIAQRVDQLQEQGLELIVLVEQAEQVAAQQVSSNVEAAPSPQIPEGFAMHLIKSPYYGLMWLWSQLVRLIGWVQSWFVNTPRQGVVIPQQERATNPASVSEELTLQKKSAE